LDFTYDNLDRLTLVEYSINDSNEVFAIDDLGNRDSVNVRDGNSVNYDMDKTVKIVNYIRWLSRMAVP